MRATIGKGEKPGGQGVAEEMLAELGRHGYREMRVGEALTRAGVSLAQFEAEFGDKDSCLLVAYERLTGRLTDAVARACRAAGRPWPQRVADGLGTLLGALAAEPLMAQAALCSFPAISPRTRARHQAFLEGFVPLLREGRELSEAAEELPAEIELLAVGAAEAIVFDEITAGRTAGLPALGPQILFSVLVPFIGPERAREEMLAAR